MCPLLKYKSASADILCRYALGHLFGLRKNPAMPVDRFNRATSVDPSNNIAGVEGVCDLVIPDRHCIS